MARTLRRAGVADAPGAVPGALVRSFERGFNALLRAYTRVLDLDLASMAAGTLAV